MRKNRLVKKVAAAAMAVAMTFATVPMGVMAEDHTRPDGKGPCNNTYRSYTHIGYQTSIAQGSHQTSEGPCIMTGLVYIHNITCSSCGKDFGISTYACTTEHSQCGSRTVNH